MEISSVMTIRAQNGLDLMSKVLFFNPFSLPSFLCFPFWKPHLNEFIEAVEFATYFFFFFQAAINTLRRA